MLGTLKRSFKKFSDHMIESPCVAVCTMDARREFCTGCYRSLNEIANWAIRSGEEKKAIIQRAAERKAASVSSP